MARRSSWLGIAVLGAVAGLGLLWWRVSDPTGGAAEAAHETLARGAASEESVTLAVPSEEPSPTNVDDAPTEEAPRDAREAVASAESGAEPSAWIGVFVSDAATGEPLEGVRLLVVGAGSDEVDGSVAFIGEAPVTGDDGRAELEVASGEDKMLLTWDPRGVVYAGEADVAAIAPGRRVEIHIPLKVTPGRRFFGRVVREENRTPIAGALVTPVGAQRGDANGTTTDADGRFKRLVADRRQRVRIEAEGRARLEVFVTRGHDDPERPLEIPLPLGANANVLVLGPDGRAAPDVRVRIRAPRDERMTLGATPLRLNDPAPGWSDETGDDGRCVFEGLPSRKPLTFELVTPAGRTSRVEPKYELAPGVTEELVFHLPKGVIVAGVVLDEGGAPVRGLEVLCDPDPAVDGYRLRAAGGDVRTHTDGNGRFAFEDMPDGSWWVWVVPGKLNVRGRLVTIEGGVPPPDLVLRASSLTIGGVVLSPSGDPVPDVLLWASPEGGGIGANGKSGRDGRFELGPLVAGPHSVRATVRDRDGVRSSESSDVDAGTQDVVIRLQPGGGIQGEVVDAFTGESVTAEVRCAPTDGRRSWMSTRSSRFSFQGLDPGSYLVFAFTDDGRAGVAGPVELAPGPTVGSIRVEVVLGARLRLLYDGEGDSAHFSVAHQGADLVPFQRVERGASATVIVPTGRVRLLWTTDENESLTLELDLAPGEERDVQL